MSETTLRQKLEALDEVSRATGKPRSRVLAAIAESWGLTPWQKLEAQQHIARTPEPDAAADAANAEAAKQVTQARADAEQQQRVDDIRTWRTYRDADPFTRARLRNAADGAIERGRALDTTDTEPPPAAA